MRKILAAILLLLPSPLWGAVTAGTTVTNTASASTVSVNVTIAGSNPVLYCGIAINGSGAPSSVVFNTSETMTELSSATAGSDYYVRVFRRIAPTAGTHAVDVTLAGATESVLMCIPTAGAHQATPEGTIVTDGHLLPGALEAAITISAGGLGLAFAFDKQIEDCGAHTSTDDEVADLCDAGPSIGGMASTSSSTGSVTMSWTGMASNYKGIVGIPVEPAAAAATGAKRVIVIE